MWRKRALDDASVPRYMLLPPNCFFRAMSSVKKTEIATFANGCFWGTEHMFRKHFGGKGLINAKVGYIGGNKSIPKPTYKQVCTGTTGYAEAAQIEFDPSSVSYAELVEFFYRTHDPTQVGGQGPDMGDQYRSALFPHTQEQTDIAQKVTSEVQAKHFNPHGTRIVTQIQMAKPEDLYVLYRSLH